MFGQEDLPVIQAVQVLPVPDAVIIAFAGEIFMEPGGEVVVDEHVQLEMHMRPFRFDDFRVGGAAHGADDLPGLHRLAHGQGGLDFVKWA